MQAVPRTLREDLWTVARDPLPSLRWLGRLPHAHAVLFAVLMGLANGNQYEPQFESPMAPAATTAVAMAVTLLVVLQSGAAILALSRPVPAWWLSTLALFLARTVGETKVSHAPLWSWSFPGSHCTPLCCSSSRCGSAPGSRPRHWGSPSCREWPHWPSRPPPSSRASFRMP